MKIQRLLRNLAVCGGSALLLIGFILRVTVRDQMDGWAVIFYATPWPVLAGLGFLMAALLGTRRRKWVAEGLVLVGLACVVGWYRQSVIRHSATGSARRCRVVCWNAEHSKRQLPEVIEAVQSYRGDIIGITEAESTQPEDLARWKAAFPNFTVRTLPGFMLFITRAEVLTSVDGNLGGAGRYNAVKLRLDGQPITVLFVEFDANPLRSRRPAFAALEELRRQHTGEEIILMGDFNTPRESFYFDALKREMVHAFEAAGNGIADTWPVPVPLLSLDHIWTTPRLRTMQCDLGWTALSDHRSIVADLTY
jgi:vancomycin resistance protein VanJ